MQFWSLELYSFPLPGDDINATTIMNTEVYYNHWENGFENVQKTIFPVTR